MRRASRTAAVAAVVAGCLAAAPPVLADQAPSLSLSQIKVGNIFLYGQQAQVGLSTDAPSVTWSAADVNGTTVASGTQATASTLQITLSVPGWYRLTVKAAQGTAVTTAQTTFGLLGKAGATPARTLGVGTHFGQSWSSNLQPLIAAAGVGNARDEAYWQNVEPTAGTYTFPAAVTSYLQTWQNNGIDPLVVADYGNPNYDGGSAPYDDAGRAAFANYADALVGHYPQIHNLAVWNEWDVNATGPANKTPESYLALLKATYAKLKADHPSLTVVGGGDVDVNQLDWFTTFCAQGGLQYLDVVSIHPYNYLGAPEGLAARIQQVKSLIRQYNGGVDKPIWITEDGWGTGTNSVSVDEPTQAEYLVRAELVALAQGVQRFYQYDFMNDGTDPANLEHNFGLVHNAADALGAYTPKPSYVAYATAARQLAGATFLRQESPGNGLNEDVFTAADGSPLRVVWAGSGANTTVTVTSSGPVHVTSLYGLPSTFNPDAGGHVTVSVGVWPTYFSGSGITALTSP